MTLLKKTLFVFILVDFDCLAHFYKNVNPTDFIISPAGNDDDAAENTCFPSTDTNDPAKRYFYRYVRFSEANSVLLKLSNYAVQ